MATPAPLGGVPRILLVEDDDDLREVLKEFLEEKGFFVDEACNGQVALDLMLSTPDPALVIMDLEMPVLTGTELLAVMKTHQRLSNVPVVVLTGSRQPPPISELIVGRLSKPCDWDGLLAVVNAFAAVPTPGIA